MDDEVELQESPELTTYPGEKPSRVSVLKQAFYDHRKIILLILALLVIFLIIIVVCAAVLIPVLIVTTSGNGHHEGENDYYGAYDYYYNDPENNNGNDDYYYSQGDDPAISCCLDNFPYHNKIWNTIEYQIKITNTKFKDRKSGCNAFLADFDKLSGLDFTFNNGNQMVRGEYDLKPSSCKSTGTEIRIRDYYSGPRSGFTTVDSKVNGKSQQEVLNVPLYPSNAQARTAFQKAEMDQHECSSKYARETRCTLESPVTLSTCQDVMDLFPGIYAAVTENVSANKVSPGPTNWWWVLEHSTTNFATTLKNGTVVYSRIDSTFTLEYNSKNEAMEGNVTPIYGEWSFRLFAQEAGPTVPWISEVTSQCLSMYNSMVKIYEPMVSC